MAAEKNARRYGFLLIDMQERFRPMISAAMIENLNNTMKLCRQKMIPIFATQHGHKRVQEDSGALGEFWNYDLSVIGDASWKLLPELELETSDYVIDEKRRYDAFHGTVLEEMLRKQQVDTVVISGVMTNLCCETTARSAFNRDFRVVFLSDGTATISQQMHDATLLNLGYGFGVVSTCQQYQAMIAG